MTRETASQMSRVIGTEIRRIRRRAGIQAVYVAEMAGWEPSKMSRIEHGYRLPVLDECPRLLGLIRATPGEFSELMSLFRTAPDGYYLWRHGPGQSEQLDCLHKLELEADSLAMYDPAGVPELLHEESTIRAFLALGSTEPGGLVKSRVQARLKQQWAFAESTLARATFFIDERCIHGFAGVSDIMQKQLRHLEFLAMTSRTHVRIIPLSATMVAQHGAVTIFESDSLPASVRIRTPLATLVLENEEDVSYYKHVLADIEQSALSEDQSLTRLGELIQDSEVEI
ncbi:DUF5753 domain-containing protein [Amycolatopsis sp. cmx-11-12]|uniref:DUF5753 domain-containing protein n=1 Tax=Amycolatopsis sp. cmx-11-12 TaxID=2785795 RepID=UPI0039182B85